MPLTVPLAAIRSSSQPAAPWLSCSAGGGTFGSGASPRDAGATIHRAGEETASIPVTVTTTTTTTSTSPGDTTGSAKPAAAPQAVPPTAGATTAGGHVASAKKRFDRRH